MCEALSEGMSSRCSGSDNLLSPNKKNCVRLHAALCSPNVSNREKFFLAVFKHYELFKRIEIIQNSKCRIIWITSSTKLAILVPNWLVYTPVPNGNLKRTVLSEMPESSCAGIHTLCFVNMLLAKLRWEVAYRPFKSENKKRNTLQVGYTWQSYLSM